MKVIGSLFVVLWWEGNGRKQACWEALLSYKSQGNVIYLPKNVLLLLRRKDKLRADLILSVLDTIKIFFKLKSHTKNSCQSNKIWSQCQASVKNFPFLCYSYQLAIKLCVVLMFKNFWSHVVGYVYTDLLQNVYI